MASGAGGWYPSDLWGGPGCTPYARVGKHKTEGLERPEGEGSNVEVSDALGMSLYEGFARRHLLTH